MSKNKTKKISVFTILIFALCLILLIYAIMAIVSVSAYIGEMIEYGSITMSDNFFDIISYYMTNCGNYVIFIAILLAIWWVRPREKFNKSDKETIEYVEISEPDVIDTAEKATLSEEEIKDEEIKTEDNKEVATEETIKENTEKEVETPETKPVEGKETSDENKQ